ncbi:MAG: sterol desaturase family protein [Methylococcaceae bacterium]|nr:sterol desaturase family protein [Methylococcaceae bacterium]
MLNNLMSQITSVLMLHQQWLKFVEGNLITTVIILSLVTLMAIEITLAKCNQSRIILIQSYLTNLATFVFNNSILSILSISSLLLFTEKYRPIGLLNDYNQMVQILFSFVLFDLTLYLWHKANHDFDCLWMFHKVHHSDKSMNVSTAFRVHFIEIILGTLVKALFIVVSGVEVSIIALCEAVSTVFILFHHFNTSVKGEKWLKWIFIVPSLHRVHHSSLRIEHDSNYGAVFSLWDRLFQTLTESKPAKIGLTKVETLNFYELLKFGLLTDVSPQAPISDNILNPENSNAMIAEAAYYIAEKRGFVSGYESMDWLQAEQQIKAFNCFAH